MKSRGIYLVLLILFCQVLISRSTKYQQSSNNDEDEDWDEDEDDDGEDSEEGYQQKPEIDDDGRIYKNPRNSPSSMCPRDEEQADRLNQKCLRKCSTDEDCKSKKKKCRCDGACGMSCIKPDRECPQPDEISHAIMTVTKKFFGDTVRYVCDPGYFAVGLSVRSCRADGQWTGSTPSCKKDTNSFCGEPPKVTNARNNALAEQTTFDLDSTVQYFCNHGYATDGFLTAKCLTKNKAPAAWYGPDISCKPKDCGPPTNIANGWHAGECYIYNCRVSYHCAQDFELVGRSEKVCSADGTWTPKESPQCVQVSSVQCPPPESPRHGKAIYTSCAFNSIVSYECRYGYAVVGDTTRRCLADKRWSGQSPLCKEINCGHPGPLYNGWIENIESGTGLGASIIFRCNPHMKLEGNASSVCQIDGRWRYPVPRCLAPCIVPKIQKGHVAVATRANDKINNVSVVEHGEKLVVICQTNYEFPSYRMPVICNNGTWTNIPRCKPARCKQLPRPPRNGMVIAPKTEHGMRAGFRCKDGFELIFKGDSHYVECSFGNWTGEIPHCREVFCPFPGYIPNGKVLLVGNMGVYDFRPYVRKIVNNKQIMYDCDRGYVLSEGAPGATCIGGNWSPKELPKCVLGQHPRLRWSRRRRSLVAMLKKNNDSFNPQCECYIYNCRVSYHCAQDFELVGRSEKVCSADGTWTPKESPQCVQVSSVQCPPPESPRHGKAIYTSCAFNSIVSYECRYGYAVVGDTTRRCLADKRWSEQSPLCKEMNCGHPGPLYNGWIENIESGTGLGASIIFRCNPHMKLEGNASSVCQIDGRWRYPVPRCLAPCIVPKIQKGHVAVATCANDKINNVSVVEHGEKLVVICQTNYKFPSYRMPVICNNGTWTNIPRCKPARCKQLPRAPRNGMVIAPKTEHGMRAGFRCKDGFELIFEGDSHYVECSFGNWTGEIPHCREVLCPFPGYIPNGKVLLVGNMGVYDFRPYVKKIVNNEQIMYDCDRGYVLSEGAPGATCIGGNWSPKELPKCVLGQHPRLR